MAKKISPRRRGDTEFCTYKQFLNLLLFLVLCIPTVAQSPPSQPAAQTPAAAKPSSTYTLPPDKLAKSEALHKLDQKLIIFGTLYSWLVLLAMLYLGIAAGFRNWAESISRRQLVQAWIFVPLLLIALALAALPLRIYAHHISLQYGLSVQGWGSWFSDYAKGQALNIVFLAFALWIMQIIIRRSPQRWWFYCWLVALPVLAFLVFIAPLVIDPLFDKFEPLENKNPALVAAIEKAVQRGGLNIPPERMYEMKASEKVTTLNAYVTGFGASKRVVVWDTTIQKMTSPEILFVFGHEMGHYVLHHIPKGMAAGAIGLLIALCVLFHLANWLLRRYGPRWQIRALDDWAAIPMIFLLGGMIGFFAEPVGNAFSRHLEHQADIYGLEITHGINADSQQIAARSFQILGELSLDYPYPNRLEVFWYWTHPPISDRLRFALQYDPWNQGEPPKYVK